ncbi:hypothetical protein [Lysinibacillus sp. SGAir0095]|uniref:hypothetical protein n=1 Tax=Lysinibacillus sp. SGAir0095 TaxID=2070463 RepID=UPI0010CD5144|nr:hypothetical protein [Lysinibacillus sp. SGAir0095]QCR33727.1 hypothetical protein C1N55_16895 [Lysinibacillus sp. SGAir0095]
MKKLAYVLVIVLTVIFTLPTPTFAAATKHLGTEQVYFPISSSGEAIVEETKYYSTGGDYRLCFSNITPYNHLGVTVLETDEAGNPSEYVLLDLYTVNNATSFCTTFNVEPYVDGTNNLAELEFRFEATKADTINVDFYD